MKKSLSTFDMKKLTIGIDISQIVHKGTGVARFTSGFIENILTYEKRHSWVFFFSSLRQPLPPHIQNLIHNSRHTLHSFHFPPSLLNHLWNSRPIYEPAFTNMYFQKFQHLDWFITSDWIEPPFRCKKATIVHDLVFKRFPETVHPYILKTQQKRLRHVAQESTCIFTDSKSTAQDLSELYDVKCPIVVNYPGVSLNTAVHSEVLKTFSLPQNYILTVGKREPRKNIQSVIEATSQLNIPLVVVGETGWGTELTGSDSVRFLGYVTDDELSALYESARMFIYPSLYEGFGYPIVEAMQYGCPVATSNTSSLSEIGGNAVLLFDPTDQISIQNAIMKLVSDEELRRSLVKKGRKRAQLYTWETYIKTCIDTLMLNS